MESKILNHHWSRAARVELLRNAGINSAADRAKQSDEATRASNAGAVLGEIMSAPDQDIPEALLKKARYCRHYYVVKGAFELWTLWQGPCRTTQCGRQLKHCS
jgi:hypothetical protein